MDTKARVIAFYLPQFHPIPENDEWWGKGFTEWTNVGRAKQLFKGHYQPRVPADLGYYDLRVPETREAQVELARNAGVEGFAYWHYWWAGKRLIERPFNEVLKSGKPDYPFCLAWANETWSGIWLGNPDKVLMEQTYPGKDDYEKHFYAVLDAFKDKRYIHVDGKPLFVVYRPLNIPDGKFYTDLWNELAIKNGLKGIYFVGVTSDPVMQAEKIFSQGFNGINTIGTANAYQKIQGRLLYKLRLKIMIKLGGLLLNRYDYKAIIKNIFTSYDSNENVYPSIMPQWDNSPRSGRRSVIYTDSTPELFKEHLEDCMKLISNKSDEHKIVFLKSWNEWAEGNYVEPDLVHGHGYLNALKEVLF
ncbi:glycoside hydrolase family 99-like domain-containing protein [Mucilaginibacter mali]|uniref:Glycoside hydrolase family 99-like domain-containing protein n=1 Tax=Mucilaginibacter mali TaxID=2740462 RepID=A0A7D4UEB6_9SPHI|nr:glycoside hydrolase family 99-like domain-containing protein [Mucilaginibacter mali]QKJ31479.1 glycoside hydrolase family 99-like domain-containing protein [Mucilaginibacter mali]